MASISVQNLTYRFDNGDTLFSDLTFTLDDKITGLVGRNGAGKSILAALLTGEKTPYSGSVTTFCRVGWLRQIGAEEKLVQHETVSDFLGVRDKLEALSRVAEGGCESHDFELIGDNWLLREELEQQLLALGLPVDPFLPCQALSGGQLTRLALHQLFQSDYGYLILDEPGNHLDEQGKHWLIEQMRRFNGGVLIISHDRDILRCVDDILELNSLGVRHYGGAYDVYAEQRANELASQERRIDHAKTQIKQMRQTMQKNREKAQQRAGQGKQVARSGSQAKILLNNKKQDAERAGGARESNQNRQMAQVQDQLSKLNKQHEMLKQQSLSLGKTEKRVSRILDITEVRLPYIQQENDITFSVDFGEKIRLSGANGSGKSTLLKAIAGRLSPLQGDIQVRAGLCYLDQHFTLLDTAKSAQENLAHFCPHLSETDQRTLLAGIGLRRERADQAVATLSGGEKMKVAMLAISHQPGDTLLLLDEPDNHLDLDSRLMLAQALRDFTGSLLVVSHDQDFIADIGVSGEISLDGSA
ncbi:ATP-binding cassette domain-containing protein [Hahella sp. CR1]|uniref:ABC-F family ATP-binding cassette domain-containing protein n=1 Tax=Hahella sp. CR1 TaxID=2992807 RepID=UPI0024432089|nr:ABC-F family ATP-binding cassette domain-containing protein [Hahella sp. CR1]MDG9669285.1 ATP-binding cassette domain-containing protein [Hahella sp. CR1]